MEFIVTANCSGRCAGNLNVNIRKASVELLVPLLYFEFYPEHIGERRKTDLSRSPERPPPPALQKLQERYLKDEKEPHRSKPIAWEEKHIRNCQFTGVLKMRFFFFPKEIWFKLFLALENVSLLFTFN